MLKSLYVCYVKKKKKKMEGEKKKVYTDFNYSYFFSLL